MNNLTVIEKESTDLVLNAKRITITNQLVYEQTANTLLCVKSLKKEIDEAFDSNIKDAHTAHKNLVAKKKTYYKPVEEAEKRIKSKIKDYEQVKAQEQEEAERKAREEAERANKEQQDKLQAEAEQAIFDGDDVKAEVLMEKAEETSIIPTATAPVIDRVKGLGIRRSYKGKIIDKAKIPFPRYWKLDETKINQEIRMMGKDANIPGVEIYYD